jgi:L-arabinokinase
MGYRLIAAVARLPVKLVANGRVQIIDPKWGGYLANVTPAKWEAKYRDLLPDVMDGRFFLEAFGGISDPVTQVDPARTYQVRHPTAHPIYEHHRVQIFRDLLAAGAATEVERLQLGELMYQSHASYGACGLGSSGTDRLVALARKAGPTGGIYGAKITGGGSGGVVAVLARAGSRAAVDGIAEEYERLTGRPAMVLGGSSDGAARFGVVKLCESSNSSNF